MYGRTRPVRSGIGMLVLSALCAWIFHMRDGNVCHKTMRQFKESVLQQDLQTMRMAIDSYCRDKGHLPSSLQALVDERYLHSIPEDPFTQKTDWITHRPADLVRGGDGMAGIDDVYPPSAPGDGGRTPDKQR